MDSNQVDSLSTIIVGTNETMNLLLPFIIGGLIMPLVAAFKKYVPGVGTVIPSEFVMGSLIMTTVYFLASWLAPTMPIEGVIDYSLRLMGGVTAGWGGLKLYKNLNK